MLFYINCGYKSSNFRDHLFKDFFINKAHIYFVNLISKDTSISIIFYFQDTYNKKMFLCHNLMTQEHFQIKLNIVIAVQNLKHYYNRSSLRF